MAIFSKILSPTDIHKRLSLPTRYMKSLPSFKGGHAVHFQVTDEKGNVWTFKCSIRKKGRYPKPVLSKGWLAFVSTKKLKAGDKITFYKERNKATTRHVYKVQAEKEIKHTPLEQLGKKHFAKGSRKSEKNGGAAASKELDNSKEIALMEAKLKKMTDLQNETIVRTKENVVKKQALTYDEMEAEREEEETQAETESDDEEQQIYNPLKLPMGWDGKPIPYWLYKLHGLGQEFKCEICGNYSYWGRRAFERHFKEWRHQHGMRCLGIPNTRNFNEITSIKEAQNLWQKIEERQGENKRRPDLEE